MVLLFEVRDISARGFSRAGGLMVAGWSAAAVDGLPASSRACLRGLVVRAMDKCLQDFTPSVRVLAARLLRAQRAGVEGIEARLMEIMAVLELHGLPPPTEEDIDEAPDVPAEHFAQQTHKQLMPFESLLGVETFESEISDAVAWERRQPFFPFSKRSLLSCVFSLFTGRTLLVLYPTEHRRSALRTADYLSRLDPRFRVGVDVAAAEVLAYNIAVVRRDTPELDTLPRHRLAHLAAWGVHDSTFPPDSIVNDVARHWSDEYLDPASYSPTLRAVLVDIRRILQRIARVGRASAAITRVWSEARIRAFLEHQAATISLVPADRPMLDHWIATHIGEVATDSAVPEAQRA